MRPVLPHAPLYIDVSEFDCCHVLRTQGIVQIPTHCSLEPHSDIGQVCFALQKPLQRRGRSKQLVAYPNKNTHERHAQRTPSRITCGKEIPSPYADAHATTTAQNAYEATQDKANLPKPSSAKETSKHPRKHESKQAHKQTNKQTNRQTNKLTN